jgi:CRISPR-associated protein Cas1
MTPYGKPVGRARQPQGRDVPGAEVFKIMESVYVLEPGSYLRKEGASLKVVKNGEVTDRIPADGLKRLMLIGYVSLSGSVLDFLIQNRVETVFVTPTGRFRARLGLDEHKHVSLRKAQYLSLDRKDFILLAAGIIVRGKIENMYRLLLLRARQYKEDAIKIGAVKLKSLAAATHEVDNLDSLRGLEGAATREYFNSFVYLIRNPSFFFNGRNRRPPRDPVNALLSFVYTLLTNEVLSAIKTVGLDPYLGSLHDISYGRPSLACDLVEEYRAFMGDRLVLGLINRQVINPDDFVFRKGPQKAYIDEAEMKANRPVEMKPAICRAFISAYEEMMNRSINYPHLKKKISYRWLILNQVRRFGNYLENPDQVYEPFTWEN